MRSHLQAHTKKFLPGLQYLEFPTQWAVANSDLEAARIRASGSTGSGCVRRDVNSWAKGRQIYMHMLPALILHGRTLIGVGHYLA